MLTRSELIAIRAVLEVDLGWEHKLTQRVHEEWKATPPEPREEEEDGPQDPR